eukprot:729407-Pyramimonas_sp.AAC.2
MFVWPRVHGIIQVVNNPLPYFPTMTVGWSPPPQEDPQDLERRAYFKLQRSAACDLIAAGKVRHMF